ncbi:hypothetical protein COT64_01865 [Candidatus Shapirobacteria bacterium CG09_land_8_20_14_0_10_39_12]|uniref:Membrane protein 6-pyruvoyl-tetrahydropterin synthase-related domain-containing protein n=1 Tax=Candidatus Shapirobacteria bacterium CG09_land_8_20_14_0_10_39_12 TaxID=1974885 RepID=A0A2H0WRM1_9BACT|nr:MAG: hypothetical protein COT64_01865 [Candidatus Shapirobacteria bacterium CG09_land_8_20_14_0_10_39_12]
MNLIKKNLSFILIVAVWLVIVLTNFSSNTFLSGWDNLHPEFNFSVNFQRALFAPWQEYQGLGLLGGMGHGADLIRLTLLWISSLVLPVNFIRYFFHFLMLLTGGLGIYFLLKDYILGKYDENIKKWGGVGGAIFYLFNLGTLQTFYLPWEAFSTHFGFLPWLFWGVFKYLKLPSKKNLLLLFLINVLSVSQGYVATIFLVYLFALSLVLACHFIFVKHDFKKIAIIYLLTFCINSFWLIPNLYFVINDVKVNTSAKGNLMSTENNLLKNIKFGNFTNVALLKGFWFDNLEIQTNGTTDHMMGDWVKHMKNPLISATGFSLFGLSVLGIIFAFKTKNKRALLFLPVFFLGFTFLANDTFGFSGLTKLFYKLPLFSQIFRFPFTKFSILTAFGMAVFYGVFFAEILRTKLSLYKGLFYGLTIFFILLPIIFLFPVFRGELFYYKEKANIPQEYFDLFEFFKVQDKNTKIANFPQTIYWGWTNYQWGKELYSGSGFLWYGISQPILDRAFDVWSSQNENYYWEITHALYSKNKDLFEKVLEKYQINWLLVDGNVINPGSNKALFLDELEDMLTADRLQTTADGGSQLAISNRPKYELVKTFGKIKIYKVNLQTPVKDFVYLAGDLPVINSYNWGNQDTAYTQYSDYISPVSDFDIRISDFGAYYPFRSLFTGRTTKDLDFQIEDLGDRFVFRKSLPKEVENYNLILPQYQADELVEIDSADLTKANYLIPTAEIKNGNIEVVIPKAKGLFSAEIEPAEKRLEAVDTTSSVSFYLPNLPHKFSYLITAESKNIAGKNLLFWLENLTNRKADIEVYLDQKINNFIIQPPMAFDGLGYTLHFDNISIGQQESVNELEKITVNPIPYGFLTGIKLVDNSEPSVVSYNNNNNLIKQVKHSNPAVYEIELNKEPGENATLVLSQAYHVGWKAYKVTGKAGLLTPVFGQEILDHVKVNNWENGWTLNYQLPITNDQFKETIVLVFLPQYLEFIGFLLLLSGFLFVIFAVK